MFLKKLSISHFKNITQTELCFSDRFNFIVGENGAGKTNLLDIVYFLCFCKSQFSETDVQNIQHHKSFTNAKGFFHRNDAEEQIFFSLQKGERKKFLKNNKEYKKLSEHIGFLPLVMISPQDYEIITGASEKRRKFIDKIIIQYDKLYLTNLIRYNKLLMQRNRLLKNFYTNHKRNLEVLDVLNLQLSPLATYIYDARKKFCDKITPLFREYYDRIAQKNEKVDLIYQSQLSEKPLAELFNSAFEKDRALQFTTVGIHRDDMDFLLDSYSMKKEGSHGQKKTYLVALKLSQYRFLNKINMLKPILILDDIFDKLDMNRFKQIIKIVENDEIFGQIFLSDTNRENILKIGNDISSDSRIFTIKEGEITQDEEKQSSKN